MIRGIGIDLCSISRMQKLVEARRFREKVFTEEETEYAMKAASPARHFASAFAAKEAFAKAGGWGISRVGLKNIWIERTASGPVFHWNDKVDELLRLAGSERVLVSISHEGDMAAAVVVLEGSDRT